MQNFAAIIYLVISLFGDNNKKKKIKKNKNCSNNAFGLFVVGVFKSE